MRDCALLLDLTHGPDPLSPYAALPPKGTFAAAAARDPGKLRLAVYRKSPLGLPISAETLVALDTAVALAREGGHTVEDIDLPFIGRDFFADFARSVASAVAGTMRAEALRVGRSVARRHRARDARARPLRRTACRPARPMPACSGCMPPRDG